MPNCSDLYVDRQLNSNPPDSYCSHQFMKVQFFKALLTNNCQYDNQSYHLGFLLGGIRFFLYRYKFWNNSGLPLRRAKGENYRQAGLGQCPLWVISGHCARRSRCPLYPRKRTSIHIGWNVCFVPKADIKNGRSQ